MHKGIALTFFLVSAFAVAEDKKPAVDPFDLSASTKNVKELGIITKAQVDKLEIRAQELFKANNCSEAVKVLEEYSKKANWLANMISANLDPYYSASYDDRKNYDFEKLRPLIPLETLSNDYKAKRNRAFAMQGECYIKLGNKEAALPLLLKALDLIDLDDTEWWTRTRNNVLSIIEVKV